MNPAADAPEDREATTQVTGAGDGPVPDLPGPQAQPQPGVETAQQVWPPPGDSRPAADDPAVEDSRSEGGPEGSRSDGRVAGRWAGNEPGPPGTPRAGAGEPVVSAVSADGAVAPGAGAGEPVVSAVSADGAVAPGAGAGEPVASAVSAGEAGVPGVGAGEPVASAVSAGEAGGPGAGHQSRARLLEDDELQRMVTRWKEIQAHFVDEPRTAVEQADALVAGLRQQLAAMLAREHAELEQRWAGGSEASTEDLRQSLRGYRSFFERLLGV